MSPAQGQTTGTWGSPNSSLSVSTLVSEHFIPHDLLYYFKQYFEKFFASMYHFFHEALQDAPTSHLEISTVFHCICASLYASA